MLYKVLLLPARIFIHLCFSRITISKSDYLKLGGPLLIAANHPNSFLDAIILAALFRKPIYSLARGDAFANKIITRLLISFNMLPVFRVSEGVENLENNYETFEACQHIFHRNGIVLIFSEGRCINEWRLRPLKKGTARLALEAWKRGMNLQVLPLGINYSAFRRTRKIVQLNFGNLITADDISDITPGKAIAGFNDLLRAQLHHLVFEGSIEDRAERKKYFYEHQPLPIQLILFIPATLGFILHLPLYLAIHFTIKSNAKDHYDSVMTGIMFFVYPWYVILLATAAGFILGKWIGFIFIALLPVTLWSYLKWRPG